MTLIKSSLFLLSFAIFSCCSSKNTVKQEPVEKSVNNSVEMLKNGFSSGTIAKSEDGSGCPFTINIDDENYGYLLDPINLEDEFMKDGLKIWFKFSPLRMQNRCEGANPVNVSEVQVK